MDIALLEYGLLGVIILLVFLTFAVWMHKMTQVIIAMTSSTLIILWWSGFLSFIESYIASLGEFTLFSLSQTQIVTLLESSQITINFLILAWILIYIIQYTSFSFPVGWTHLSGRTMQILFSPLAIFSMIISLSVALLWIDVLSPIFLTQVGEKFWTQHFIYYCMFYLPLGIVIQWLTTLILLFKKNVTNVTSYDDI